MKEILDKLREAFRREVMLDSRDLNGLVEAVHQTEEAHVAHALVNYQIRQERLAQRTVNELKRIVRY